MAIDCCVEVKKSSSSAERLGLVVLVVLVLVGGRLRIFRGNAEEEKEERNDSPNLLPLY